MLKNALSFLVAAIFFTGVVPGTAGAVGIGRPKPKVEVDITTKGGHFYLVNHVFETDASLMTYHGVDVERYAWYLAIPVIVGAKAAALLMTPGGQWSAAAITLMYVPKAIPLQIGKTMLRLKTEALYRARLQLLALENMPGATVKDVLRLEGVELNISQYITKSIKLNSVYIVRTEEPLPRGYTAQLPVANGKSETVNFTEIGDLGDAHLKFRYRTAEVAKEGTLHPSAPREDLKAFTPTLKDMLHSLRMPSDLNKEWQSAYKADEKLGNQASVDLSIEVENREIPLGVFVGHHGMKKFLGVGLWQKLQYFLRKATAQEGTGQLEGQDLKMETFSHESP